MISNTPPNGWAEHLRIILDEREHRYSQRFASIEETAMATAAAAKEAVAAAFAASEKAVTAALAAAKEAVAAALTAVERASTKTEEAQEHRLRELNDYRATVETLIRTMMPQREADVKFDALSAKIDLLRDSVDKLQRDMARWQGRYAGITATVAFLVTALTVLLNVWSP